MKPSFECGSCLFFSEPPGEGAPTIAYCHRRSPSLDGLGFPAVRRDTFCGDFISREGGYLPVSYTTGAREERERS